MTIYVLQDSYITVKGYKSIKSARQALDAEMFAKCKRGFRILEAKGDSYIYGDNSNNKYKLYLNEIELLE